MGVQHWSKQHAPHLFDGGTGGGHAIAELLEHHDWPAFVLASDLLPLREASGFVQWWFGLVVN